jgi:hypothetical protein
MDDVLFLILAICSLVVGILFGSAFRIDVVKNDCEDFGATRISGQMYKCERMK